MGKKFYLKSDIVFFCLAAVIAAGFSGCDRGSDGVAPEQQMHQSKSQRDYNPQVASGEVEELVSGNTAFACELYNVIKAEGENLFFSPYSISIALAMTYAGARSNTAQEMEDILHFTLGQEGLHPAFNKLDLELENRGQNAAGIDNHPFRLNINNALWGEKTYSFEQNFIDVLGINYGAGMNLLDFKTAPDASRILINHWVEDKTEEKIKNLLGPGTIGSDTRLVLTNTIYFNAAWASQFEENATAEGPFSLLDGISVTVPLMTQTAYFPYLEDTQLQAVELPYDGHEISMVIILPKSGQFSAVESSLDENRLTQILGSLSRHNLVLTMPRFKYKSAAISLKPALQSMGMVTPFSPGSADFSGMDGAGNLFISNVFHKAFVDVNEQGTEAAAATAVVMAETSIPAKPLECCIDRPFLFFIRDRATNAVLFMGRILDPR